MIKSSVLQIQITCPGCNSFHNVRSFSDFDTCQNCGHNLDTGTILIEKMLGFMDRVNYVNAFVSGRIEQIGGSNAYRLEFSSVPVYCEECKNTFDEKILTEVIDNNKPLKCSSCSHVMPVKPAGSFIKNFHPKAIGVINDSSGSDAGKREKEKSSMIVFGCMTCGGALELTDKTKRLIKCTFCGNENYLPDEIWTRLHPNTDVIPLFLLTDIDEDDIEKSIDYFLNVTSVKIYGKHFENFIREYFEKPFVSDSLLSWMKYFLGTKTPDQLGFNMDISKLRKYFYDNFLLGIETHPAELKQTVAEYSADIPPEIQRKLADDRNESVRLALTKNKNLEKDVIRKLQNDTSQTVSAEAKKIKTGFLKNLFG
ncbi:MAG TPA: hypothetical protein PKC91_11990 [Ignavibacteria bacterium]|nr:hypothetical protein [Ignavibacteria bacterium]